MTTQLKAISGPEIKMFNPAGFFRILTHNIVTVSNNLDIT